MISNDYQLKKIKPEMAEIVRKILLALMAKNWQPWIASALRTIEEEKEKIRKGVSHISNPANDPHVKGLAVDIVDKKYLWNVPITHQFWYDYLLESLKYPQIRTGILWSHPERLPIYKKAVETNNPKLITWFCDVAHIEYRK